MTDNSQRFIDAINEDINGLADRVLDKIDDRAREMKIPADQIQGLLRKVCTDLDLADMWIDYVE